MSGSDQGDLDARLERILGKVGTGKPAVGQPQPSAATSPDKPTPADLEKRLARIVGLLEQHEATTAEPLARDARVVYPDNAEIARMHGISLLMTGRIGEARDALETALHLQPGNVEAGSNLASALLADDDADAAVALLQEVVESRPNDPALRNNLANALRAAGDDEGARNVYLAALTIAPNHLGAILNLAAVELSLACTRTPKPACTQYWSRSPTQRHCCCWATR